MRKSSHIRGTDLANNFALNFRGKRVTYKTSGVLFRDLATTVLRFDCRNLVSTLFPSVTAFVLLSLESKSTRFSRENRIRVT